MRISATGAEFLADIQEYAMQGLQYHYVIRDHLGSPRVIFSDKNNNGTVDAGEVEDVKNFYLFGLEWDETPTNHVGQYRKSFTGQERVSHTNILEFQYRCLLKGAGVWDGPDPLSRDYPGMATGVYAVGNPLLFKDILGDSIIYANDEIQNYVKKYSAPTITNRKGKIKSNRHYDAEFAAIISEIEKSEMVFHFSNSSISLEGDQLGLVSSRGDGRNFDVYIPNHGGTLKADDQQIFGGRGSILAEETYHAVQIIRGDIVPQSGSKGFVTGTSTIGGAEIDAKIWAANRSMVQLSTDYKDARISTIPGLIKSFEGNRMKVLNLLQKGATKTYLRNHGRQITVNYPPSYKF